MGDRPEAAAATQPGPLPNLAAGCTHPEANRRAVLLGQSVAYRFRRGRRSTIGFSIGVQGLTVSAPRWVPLAAVDDALQSKADWVLRKLAQVTQRHQDWQDLRPLWGDGTRLPWLGESLGVRLGTVPVLAPLTESLARPRRRSTVPVHRQGDTLWVGLPPGAESETLQRAVQAWMMQAAHAHFVQRLNHFAPLLGVRWTSLRLSNARTRWGSAKADGSIRLHWRLMQMAPGVIDYVVAHELSHLRHMDHSPRFWATVASVVPDHAAWRSRLKSERLPPW